MSDLAGLSDLVREIKQASENIEMGDARTAERIEGLEKHINELYKKTSRPGGFDGYREDELYERKSAVEMCKMRHNERLPKSDLTTAEYAPTGRRD